MLHRFLLKEEDFEFDEGFRFAFDLGGDLLLEEDDDDDDDEFFDGSAFFPGFVFDDDVFLESDPLESRTRLLARLASPSSSTARHEGVLTTGLFSGLLRSVTSASRVPYGEVGAGGR
jgi:hypothetical protein